MKYLTKEQEIVVKSRVTNGYTSELLNDGNILLYKGKHTMIINCFGYCIYTPKGNM